MARDVRQARPQVTISRDRRGDYTDVAGRGVIFRIHGQPPWMLMVDHRCIARTDTVRAAAQIAWTQLHRQDVATRTAGGAGHARP